MSIPLPRRFVVVLLLAGLSLGVLAFLDRRSVDALASDFIVMQGDDVVLESDALPPLYAGSRPLPLSKILAGLRPLPEPRPAHEGDALADALLRSDLMESILPGASLDSFDTYLTRLESGNCLLCGMEGAGGHPSRSAFSGGGAGFMVLGGGLGGGGGDQGAPGTDDSLAPGGFADAAGGPASPGETTGGGDEPGAGFTPPGGPSPQDHRGLGRESIVGVNHVDGRPQSAPVLPTPVPEPATIVLTGSGIAALFAARFKHRR